MSDQKDQPTPKAAPLQPYQCSGCLLDIRPCRDPKDCMEMGICTGRNPACAEYERIVKGDLPIHGTIKVLVISTFKDYMQGTPSVVLAMPNNLDEKECFRRWYNTTHKTNHSLEEMATKHQFDYSFESCPLDLVTLS